MSIKTPTKYGPNIDFSSATDADELFIKHSVPELRSLEKRTRSDIEEKKQELRLMVGERYRDLIDAADSIVNMRKCALSIQEELHHMQDSCDVHALKRSVRTQVNEDNKGSKDEKKYHLYSSAAQIKLLVDVPEQIWRSLESHKYLNASRLYLIAKLVYKNLQAHDDTPFNVSVTFPVVQRQWDAVSHFKSQILQKARYYLKITEQSEQSLAETLCAIMLLDDVTKKDVFQLCLDGRTSVLSQLLEKSVTKDVKSLTEQFKEIIHIIRSTVFHVGLVFIRTGDDLSLFESYLHQLQQGFSVNEDNLQTPSSVLSPCDSKASLTQLYSSSANIHLLMRYLPESIQTFTPFFHMSGPRGNFTQDDIHERMNGWFDYIVQLFREKIGILLSKVTCARDLNELRKNIWNILKDDESSKEEEKSSIIKHPSKVHRTSLGFILNIQRTTWSWSFACNIVFNNYFSIWNDLLRQNFNKRFQDIIQSLLAGISKQPEKLFKNRLHKLDNPNNEERHLGKFIWAHDSIFSSENFQENMNLKDIRDDMEYVFALINNRTDELFHDKKFNGKLFNAYSDTEDLFGFFQDTLMSSVISYRNQLNGLIEEVDAFEKSQEIKSIVENNAKRLFIARISQTIAYESLELPTLLQITTGRDKPNYFSSRLSSAPDPRLVNLRHLLMEVYFLAHKPWMQWITNNAQEAVFKMLYNSPWNESNIQTLVWEEISMQDKANPGDNNKGAKIILPSQSSSELLKCLYNICKELNRVGSPTLHENIIKDLFAELSLRIIRKYNSFTLDEESFTKVSEKGAIQLLFDIKFLRKVFEGCWTLDQDDPNEDDNKTYQEKEEMFNQSLRAIKLKIDPIDLTIFEPYLNKNVERHYARSSIMLGLLFQLNPKITDMRRKSITLQDYHNIIMPVVPQAARFTLLPISHKPSGGNLKSS
ncbi:conserved oligomeric Golgi complex subunit 1-like [Rhizophagus clarus]|uniref:Conserved oligomeric Golgi complex subunit 1 n=1 Tax=Rhizophagus clarus TaxID=94130 RepID=A0A8H3R156_9GLOM|nr:conserved oligomeric Golgi complex subunit 1-like [Rhizophagus clarus]